MWVYRVYKTTKLINMAVKIGESPISAVYIGESTISAMYIGETIIYP